MFCSALAQYSRKAEAQYLIPRPPTEHGNEVAIKGTSPSSAPVPTLYHPADFFGFISRIFGQEVKHGASLTVLQLQVGPLVEEQLHCIRLTTHCSLM